MSALVIRTLGALQRRSQDDRGAIVILAALLLTLMILAAALSVDIGGEEEEIRRDQATADLAALDASRDLSSDAVTLDLAQRSALRNGVDATKSGIVVTATRGTMSNGNFTAGGAGPTAVKVTVSTPYRNFFAVGSALPKGTAVATVSGIAGFSVGSTLADINAGLGPFGSMRLQAVGYNGLAGGNANVTLGALSTALGFGALTPDQILASQVSVGQLVNAAATLLSASDPTASASLSTLGGLLMAATFDSTNKVTLGQAVGLQQGSGVALGSSINLLGAVTGGIQLADQKAGIAANLSVTAGSLTSVSMSVTAIVPASTYYGPVGGSVTNTQVTVNLGIVLDIQVLLSVAHVSLPLTLTLGGATGTLKAIDCSGTNPLDIKVGTTFKQVSATTPGGTVTGLVGLVNNTFTGGVTVAQNAVADATLNYPANFAPNQAPVTVSSNPGTVTANFTGQGLTGSLTAATLNATVAAAMPPILTAVNNYLGGNLGINVGNADYLGLQPPPSCAVPRLVQ